ncbi:MAG TPA: TldD/PmbA family protein [Thermoleophilaceae bacterium]|nr:TldD/PmbA family protein [Thermoleophilaceae bacterium]
MSAATDISGVAARAIEAAAAAGAGEAEAWCEQSVSRQIRVYEGAVESLTDSGARGLGVRAFLGGRSGYAYGTDLSPSGLEAIARAAVEAASIADEDEHAGLPDETGSSDVAGLHSPEIAAWTTERKVDLALAVERAARAIDGVSQVEDTVYADTEGRSAFANTRGGSGEYEASAAWAWCSAFAGEGADLMTGLGVDMARDPAGLDPEAIGAEAGGRALELRGARQVASRRCPVVLDAFVAASFLGFIGGMLSAEAVQRGRSLFAGREGDEVASAALRLVDDPTDADGPSSAPFDGEGSPTGVTPLIEGGRLQGYLFDVQTARRAGRATTGNATRGSYRSPPRVGATNLVADAGTDTLAELVRRAGDGMLVTDVAGLHSGVNPVSGNFSVGATGRLIEGGELGAPVREMTIASDLVSMLRAIAAVGSESRWVPFGGSVRAAPLLLSEMSVSGS